MQFRLSLLVYIVMASIGFELSAMPLSVYAEHSRLAQGRWTRIEVKEAGMQFISNTQLKAWGYSNPDKVNIYGYGGKLLSENLNEDSYIDDLPMQPVIRTSTGILFYGTGTITYKTEKPSYDFHTKFRAVQNHFSSNSYYFLSDVEAESADMQEINCKPTGGYETTTNWFLERLLHEKELAPPYKSGAWMLGEDFTQQHKQEFKFDLPGKVDDNVAISVGFGTVSPTVTPVYIYANGEELPNNIILGDISSDDPFLEFRYITNSYSMSGDKLTVGVEIQPGGLMKLARLGSISINYARKLALTNGLLSFHSTDENNPQCVYEIDGCSSTTQIWDITDESKPKRILYELRDGKAYFVPQSTEYKEYVVFEPEKVTLTPMSTFTSISNQDLHAIPTPDMVIISPREYVSQAKRIAEMHSDLDGMDVLIVTPEQFYNEFSSGKLDPTAFRKALKMWYDRDKTKLKYCLILGRAAYDYRDITGAIKKDGYPRVPAWMSPGESAATKNYSGYTSHVSSYLTDDYITLLEDNESSFSMATAKMSIAVGRMPFYSSEHARQMTDKLLKYVYEPEYGKWRNHVTIISDNGDIQDHFKASEASYSNMVSNGGEHTVFEKIYLGGETWVMTSSGMEYPAAKAKMMRDFNQGTSLTWYIGHANTREWTHENLFNYTDITSMTNKRWPIFMTATCQFTRWDDDDLSGGEILWSHPEAGSIAQLSTTRSVLIMNCHKVTSPLAQRYFWKDDKGRPLTIGEWARIGKNATIDFTKVIDRYFFQVCGDPAMRLPGATLNAKVEQINGMDVDTIYDSNLPVFKGGAQIPISGTIYRGTKVANDFNGTLYLTLYDAERAIETNDPLSADQMVYNSRTTCLYNGVVNVKNGRWSTELLIPVDIENNFSPAFLSLYAHSKSGLEAIGSTKKMIIYGVEENTTDYDGPEITGIGLNSYNFVNGGHVSANTIFMASFTDPSGINQSKAGIGNEMLISIDGKKFYNDLLEYYQPSATDIHAGSVMYPISDLEPGRHTLEFTVSDIYGNTTKKTIDFAVSVSAKPILYDINTDCNPASTSVTFTLLHDRLLENTECTVEVYNLSGRKVWSGKTTGKVGLDAPAQIYWNLNDGAGVRVPRGIYLYRATVKTSEGAYVSKTKKLAVTAQ